MNVVNFIIIAVVGYFLGNFSTGLLVGKRVARIDIRQHGSGNAGTTNILRTLGWLPSVLTLLGDALKAALAGLIGLWLAGPSGAQLGGLCAVIGHNWPVLFGFRGGKGMAASFGAILVIDPALALGLLVVQAALLAATRYMSIASLATSALYPALTLLLRFGAWGQFVFALVLAALAVFSHRDNIRRLCTHSENRLDFSRISKLSKRG